MKIIIAIVLGFLSAVFLFTFTFGVYALLDSGTYERRDVNVVYVVYIMAVAILSYIIYRGIT